MTDVWVMPYVSEADMAETEHPSLRYTGSWYPPTTRHLEQNPEGWTTRTPKGAAEFLMTPWVCEGGGEDRVVAHQMQRMNFLLQAYVFPEVFQRVAFLSHQVWLVTEE